ncbi:MAG: SIS domain-containing protein, partial [Chloroflexota bacterium]|nr:SIS domain-containing protein [Chloroflexota bacterium]
NMPLITAWGNDVSYDSVFVEPLRNLMRPADILVAISTSGNSSNILSAVTCAHEEFSGTVIAITGNQGGVLADVSDLVVRIPSEHIGHQEDGHLIVNHVVCNALAERIGELE